MTVPQSSETRTPSTGTDALLRAIQAAVERKLEAAVTAVLTQEGGFTAALKTLNSLNEGRFQTHGMGTVQEGVYERSTSGRYELALQTDEGPLLLRNARDANRESTDPQLIGSSTSESIYATADSGAFTADQLLRQLVDAGANPSCSLICQVELARFDPSQQQGLLPLLWQYILGHRNSNARDEIVAVGSAIRKYIAIMPMDRMGELAVLLESGHRSPLPIDLEIEVAKMIYRNYEVHPPASAEPQPELAQRLWEMVQAYTNPRILLRDKHSAAASLAIEAIVAMRSSLAKDAWEAAAKCPYHWFAELVSDDLEDLQEQWCEKNSASADWLCDLRDSVATAHA